MAADRGGVAGAVILATAGLALVDPGRPSSGRNRRPPSRDDDLTARGAADHARARTCVPRTTAAVPWGTAARGTGTGTGRRRGADAGGASPTPPAARPGRTRRALGRATGPPAPGGTTLPSP